RADDLRRLIENRDAAALELRDHRRIVEQPPAVDRCVGDPGVQRLCVVAQARGDPHVVCGVLVAWIVLLYVALHRRIQVLEVRQLGFVELLERAGADLELEERGGRHDNVEAGVAGQELGLEHLVLVEDIVVDLDAVLLLEVTEYLRIDVIRPVVHVDDFVAARSAGAGGQQHQRHREPHGAPQFHGRQGLILELAHRQTLSNRCSRSQELITCRNTSYSASLTMVKAETNGSPSSLTSGSLVRSSRSASSSDRGSPKGSSCALPVMGSLGCKPSTMPR